MTFNIREFVTFNDKGRGRCPSCVASKGTNHRKLNLSVNPESGAYKCFAGCTPKDIRVALGQEKVNVIPTAIAQSTPPAKPQTVTPAKVKQATETLLNSAGPAKEWLAKKGITDEMIAYYKLGGIKKRFNNKDYWGICVPIPATETTWHLKTRVAPWRDPASDKLLADMPWHQKGIPAQVWFTHNPPEAQATYLCEGEWDAIRLGWEVKEAGLAVAVACFTCGCSSVPPSNELERLPGRVYIFYDRNDKPTKSGIIPGDAGAEKVAAALGERGAIALVPMPEDCTVNGWDVSDALNHGYTLHDFQAATAQAITRAVAEPAKPANPLRQRLITNDELIARAPDYVEWLVPDILPANEMILLAASPRAGKSLLALLLAKCIASGENFLDRPVTQGPVIYIRCEDSEVKVKVREKAQGWGENLPVYWLDRFRLSELAQLRELAEEIDPRLIVLDTLSNVRDDNMTESSAEMSRVLDPLRELGEDLNCCILLVHHTRKVSVDNADTLEVFDTIRGSGSIRATCRGCMVLAADTDNYRLCVENGYDKLDLRLRLDTTNLHWKLLGRWNPTINTDQKSLVTDYLAKVGEATIEQISEETQLAKAGLYSVLSRLVADGVITKKGSRRRVIYTRSSNLIKQFDNLFDDANADTARAEGTYQTKNIFSEPNTTLLTNQQVIKQAPPQNADLFDNSQNPLPEPIPSSNKNRLFDEVCSGDKLQVKTGQFVGKYVNVIRVLADNRVEVKHPDWLITRTYSLDEVARVIPSEGKP